MFGAAAADKHRAKCFTCTLKEQLVIFSCNLSRAVINWLAKINTLFERCCSHPSATMLAWNLVYCLYYFPSAFIFGMMSYSGIELAVIRGRGTRGTSPNGNDDSPPYCPIPEFCITLIFYYIQNVQTCINRAYRFLCIFFQFVWLYTESPAVSTVILN